MRRKAMPLAVLAAVLGLASGGGADEAYRATVKKWRDEREARLKADGGWLSVAGLFWLKPGENRFGTDKAAAVVLPEGSAPPVAGVFELKGTETTVRLAEGTLARMAGLPLAGPAVLRPDSGDVVELGPVTLQVIERGGRFGIRLKDKNAAARREFTGCRWYEVKEDYRIEAKWVAHKEPRPLKVPNILGQTESMPSPGYAEFSVGGKTVRLDGVLETAQSTAALVHPARPDERPRDVSGRPLPVRRPAQARQGRPRLQQVLQPALRFHGLRDLPAAAPPELDAGEDRGGRAELRQALDRQTGHRGARGRIVPKNARHQPGHSCPLRDRSCRAQPTRGATDERARACWTGRGVEHPVPPLDSRHVPLVDLHVVLQVVLGLLVLRRYRRFEKVWK